MRHKKTNKNPPVKPPICAHQATLPELSFDPGNEKNPFRNCNRNQIPKKKNAGTSITVQTINIGSNVTIFAPGKSKKYAPKTPAIHPLAMSDDRFAVFALGFTVGKDRPLVVGQVKRLDLLDG